VSIDKDFIAGVINALAWGLGYAVTGKFFYGGIWLAIYGLVHLSFFFLGYEFYVATAPGNLLVMAFSFISAAFLYQGIENTIKANDSWKKLRENLPIFIPAAIVAGFMSEFANEFYLGRWWIYQSPWSLFGLFGTRIGPLLLAGWLIMLGVTISSSYLLDKYLKSGIFFSWMASWLAVGFIAETFNALVWRTWHYHAGTIWKAFPIPGLGYGILVPLLGYTATGLFTYLTYITALKLLDQVRAFWRVAIWVKQP
jgi:hypothetical protein